MFSSISSQCGCVIRLVATRDYFETDVLCNSVLLVYSYKQTHSSVQDTTCATVVSILCTIVAETEEKHSHGQSLPLGRLSQFHPHHILVSYFPMIQPTNLLGLSSEFCPRGSPRQAAHIPWASHPIHTPQPIVASYKTQNPCIINEVSRHVTLNSPLTSCFSWPNIFLSAMFLNVPSKQQAC
jgi:hypothetical protein